jgi:probable HAF family extracellular repeat protein
MSATRVMKTILVVLSALTPLPLRMMAQIEAEQAKHHHYKLIDLGTFGGPLNYVNTGVDLLGPSVNPGPVQDVNFAGTLAGWADTSFSDPYGPTYCFNGDCLVSHAFKWRDGFKTDLGVLPLGASSATTWISANGLIVGASQNGQLDPLLEGFPEDQAVLWRDNEIVNLGSLPEGGYENGAQSVNSRGQVVGWAFNTVPDPYSMGGVTGVNLYNFYDPYPYYFQERAFLWQDGVMQDLGTLGTGTDALAIEINEPGQVIGISYTSSIPNQEPSPCSAVNTGLLPTVDPFFWENGKMVDLGTLGGTCGIPWWLNDRGQVVGTSYLAGDQVAHAFRWTKATGMQDLGSLGGSFAYAAMVNDFGQIVGGSSLANGQYDAFLWDGKMHDLGALDGCALAFAVNRQGQVVGNWGGPQCAEGAFLWEHGAMIDLNTLVSSTTDLYVAGAIQINDRGEIVGSACANGNCYAMLLVPCDENHPGIEGCDYSMVDATNAPQTRAPKGNSGSPKNKNGAQL